jgi:hypothetical protein
MLPYAETLTEGPFRLFQFEPARKQVMATLSQKASGRNARKILVWFKERR